ncbi:unnamed protein product [Phytophthora lilii]|uniref:Unnamed protein product n=1 Tax=Phytophthora lilii TaxID=2077276 RepID=A0A9W6XDY6_9STRA|nr:unnamed protein product [Phytophthora lilii]
MDEKDQAIWNKQTGDGRAGQDTRPISKTATGTGPSRPSSTECRIFKKISMMNAVMFTRYGAFYVVTAARLAIRTWPFAQEAQLSE